MAAGEAAGWSGGHRVAILCADDYAISGGVSAGIEELAVSGRLSATSALVTRRHWRSHAGRLEMLRSRIAVGLHLNLTLGEPLGPMPHLAPSGTFLSVRRLLVRSLAGQLDEAEIASEVARQLDSFEDALGHAPDMIDGHQHVHAFPQIRRALLRVLTQRYPTAKPMLRDITDSPTAIVARGIAVPKALVLTVLGTRFGTRARALGFPVNRGFSGASSFDRRVPYGAELSRYFVRPGPRHLIMCHPGYPDDELARIDTLIARRMDELEALRADPDLPARIVHPKRGESGGILWSCCDG